MPFVLDASVALAWALPDESSSYANSAIELLRGDDALVPGIWPLELANGLVMAVRRRRISEADAARSADLALGLSIVVVDSSQELLLRDIRNLATEHSLTAYDACYLDLAMREGLPLCTEDRALRSAARRTGVPVVQ